MQFKKNKHPDQIKKLEQIKKLKSDLQNPEKGDLLTALLNLECCQNIIKKTEQFRQRIYTPFQTIRSFIKQALDEDKSCSNAVISVAVERFCEGKKSISINTGPYVKARKRLPEETIHSLVNEVGRESLKTASVSWKFHDREVKLCDGTSSQMPDTEANKKVFPKHNNKKKNIGFPLVRLEAVMSLTTGSVIDYTMAACKGKGTGEISLLRKILGCIEENDILIGDSLYCNYFLTCDLLSKNADILVPGHNQRCYDFRKGLRLDKKDHIVDWKKPKRPEWMTQQEYAQYPKQIQIRELKVGGVIYMTTLLKAQEYHKNELALLYRRRWEIETNLNSIKTIMGMDKLSCKSPDMIKKEIGVYLLAYNIIRHIMVSACIQHEALPNRVSFKGTVQLLNEFMPYLVAYSSKKKKQLLYNELIKLIVTKKVGNRPERHEPRAVKSRPKTFPILKNPRKVEQAKLRKKVNKIIKMIENEALAA
jgi:IS4 transposase